MLKLRFQKVDPESNDGVLAPLVYPESALLGLLRAELVQFLDLHTKLNVIKFVFCFFTLQIIILKSLIQAKKNLAFLAGKINKSLPCPMAKVLLQQATWPGAKLTFGRTTCDQ